MTKIKIQSGAAEPVALVPIAPILDHQCISLDTTPVCPTLENNTRGVLVQAVDGDIRYTIGTYSSPTPTCGFKLVADNPPILIPIGPGVNVCFVAETAATLNLQQVE